MYENQNWLFIIPISIMILLVLYLGGLFVLRFVLKIKRNYMVEGKAQKSLPKWFKYTYMILVLISAIAYFVYEKTFAFFLVVLLINQCVISKITLTLLEDKREKYYPYTTIAFSSIFIVLLFVTEILSIL